MANILVVDDHPDTQQVLGQILALSGHNVSFADSGETAWDRVQSTPLDAVVIDQRLPGMSGMEFLELVRTSPFKGIEVVLCSAEDSQRDAALAGGAADFWLKGSDQIFDKAMNFGKRLKKP